MADGPPPLSTATVPLHADAAAFLLLRRRSPAAASADLLLLAASTYELVQEAEEGKKSERRGGIHLFDASAGELSPLGGVGSGGKEESSSSLPFPGVFDIKWLPRRPSAGEDPAPVLAVALADGSVRLMEVKIEEGGEGEGGKRAALLRETARCSPLKVDDDRGEEEPELEEEEQKLPCTSHPLDDPEAMALYLDVEKGSTNRIAVSFSDGRVAVLELLPTNSTETEESGSDETNSKSSRLEVKALWRAHNSECWCVSFSPRCPDTVYTGADDCEFLAWDLRGIGGSAKKPKPSWRAGAGGGASEEAAKHSAGVCCISPSPDAAGASMIVTGSYDGRVRLWDSRDPSAPLFLCASEEEEKGREGEETANSSPPPSSSPLGGGAWRLVWHPRGEPRLLCAAMHAGFAVLKLDKEGREGEKEAKTSSIEVEQRYRRHGADPSPLNGGAATLGYGCDWAFDAGSNLIAATASFYDNGVHLWGPR